MKSINSQYLQFLLQICEVGIWTKIQYALKFSPDLKFQLRNRITHFQPSQMVFYFVICDAIFARAQRGPGKRCVVIESFLAADHTISDRISKYLLSRRTLHKHILLSCHCHAFVSFNGEVMMKLSWYANSLLTQSLCQLRKVLTTKRISQMFWFKIILSDREAMIFH